MRQLILSHADRLAWKAHKRRCKKKGILPLEKAEWRKRRKANVREARCREAEDRELWPHR